MANDDFWIQGWKRRDDGRYQHSPSDTIVSVVNGMLHVSLREPVRTADIPASIIATLFGLDVVP